MVTNSTAMVRGRPFLRMVFPFWTKCKFALTHPPTPEFTQIGEENMYNRGEKI